MTMDLGWRRFNFFEKEDVPDPIDPSQPFSAFKGLNLSFREVGDGFALLGNTDGMIFRVERELQLQVWKAYQKSLNGFAYQKGYLATVGADDDTSGYIVKLWNMNSWSENEPHCLIQSKLALGKSKISVPPICIALASSVDLICVGTKDSTILFYHGDLINDKKFIWKNLDNSAASGDLIGLAVDSRPNIHIIFVIKTVTVTSFLLENGAVVRKVNHDAKGCEKDCFYFNNSDNSLILANRDMVYFYDASNVLEPGNEKGQCYALARGLDKVQIVKHNHYVVLLTQKPAVIKSSENATMCVLNIYDVEFKYLAFHYPIPTDCQIFILDDVIFLLLSDGRLMKIIEKPLIEKLESLKKKNLFDVAIGLASRHKYHDLANIYVKYGDYLYAKGDFENSCKQYMETLDVIEPSYVIKKFVDGSRIPQLCAYLEHLHKKKVANGQHSILLLSALIKSNNQEKILEFVENSPKINEFDYPTAIQILREAKLSDIALKLAKIQGELELYLDILITDFAEFPKAIKFIGQCNVDDKMTFLTNYGTILFKEDRKAVTEMIKQVVLEKPDVSKALIRTVLEDGECLEEIFKNPTGSGVLSPQDSATSVALLEHLISKMTDKEKKDPKKLDQLYDLIRPDVVTDAIQLGRQYNVPALVIHVYRKTKKTEDLLRYLLQEGDLENVIEMCDERLLKDMWIELITHVARKKDLNPEDLIKLLDKAKSANFVHPLVVLEILARNDNLKIADILDYIVNWLETQNKFIDEHEKLIEKNEAEIEEMDKKADSLEHGVQIFQISKCSACDAPLAVPAVHFVCNHSFHRHCFESFSDGQEECPVCASAESQVVPTKRGSNGISHLTFLQELQNSDDAISLIASYIAKGAFEAS
ncbi:unnamed protein product [Bursaphelenchus xylophilus]|uniref:(pine wood nematode) hypothetical protein n=1 Tax=Bursaphelenchus xylophilus TaxID=6326 RepID=A0A1I7S4K6_BURXY|nr:unnamed protein product [Bursaphelenchus xylophilus]CAG9117203.1 unnamed protein product [Bursaphelenchus xylophilus]